MTLELRETLADVLGGIVANERKRHRELLTELKSEADATIARLQDTIDELREKALAHIESLTPVPGKDGVDGQDGAPGRDGIDGKDGKDGIDGVNGKDGRDGIDGKDGAPGLNGSDGKNGLDGLAGAKGEPGEPGEDGESGRDGRDGLAGVQGPAGLDGKDGLHGKDGRDGLDGFGFDDLACSYDGGRMLTLAFSQGERVKEFTFKLPIPLDRGVFRTGTVYDKGDSVTYGGSCWLAQKDEAKGKPGESADWRLSTKHGRDGKQGERGLPGKEGAPGRDGRDLTQLGFDGQKW